MIRNRSGSRLVVSDISGTSYDSGAAHAAQRQVAADQAAGAERIAAAERAALSRVSDLFQRNTLEPGESISGAFLIERPDVLGCRADDVTLKCRLTILVEVAGDEHRFAFTEKP